MERSSAGGWKGARPRSSSFMCNGSCPQTTAARSYVPGTGRRKHTLGSRAQNDNLNPNQRRGSESAPSRSLWAKHGSCIRLSSVWYICSIATCTSQLYGARCHAPLEPPAGQACCPAPTSNRQSVHRCNLLAQLRLGHI